MEDASLTSKQRVAGSSPAGSAISFQNLRITLLVDQFLANSRLSEGTVKLSSLAAFSPLAATAKSLILSL